MNDGRWSLAAVSMFALLLVALPGPAGAATFTVDSTADDVDVAPGDGICATAGGMCTLRAAIQEANALPGADTIEVPAGRYAITIPEAVPGEDEDAAARGDFDIAEDLSVTGAGVDATVVDGNGLNRVFQILAPATAQITGLTIRGGKLDFGAGIFNQGTLTLTDVAVTDNNGAPLDLGVAPFDETGCSADGAGIENDGTLTAQNLLIARNRACGFSTGGGLLNLGTATLTNVTVTRNRAAGGGGIINWGTLSLTNAIITKNKVHASRCQTGAYLFCQGGGLLNGGTATLVNATIAQNRARGSKGGLGGGIANTLTNSGLVTLVNTIVADNVPINCFGYGSTCFTEGPNCIFSRGHNLSSPENGGSCSAIGPGDVTGEPRLHGRIGPLQVVGLAAGSPAIDAGDDAACPATDALGQARPVDGDGDGVARCDIGAFELP